MRCIFHSYKLYIHKCTLKCYYILLANIIAIHRKLANSFRTVIYTYNKHFNVNSTYKTANQLAQLYQINNTIPFIVYNNSNRNSINVTF